MRTAEMRDMSDDELLLQLETHKEELFNLRFQFATGQLDNPMRIKQVRHEVARILTLLRERHREAEVEIAVAAADERSLEEGREALARGDVKTQDLADMQSEAMAGGGIMDDESEMEERT